MKHEEFEIGQEFTSAEHRYRCTDKGTRVIVAIRVDRVNVVTTNPTQERTLDQKQAENEGWFNGPPYAVVERVFDEYDQEICKPCQ